MVQRMKGPAALFLLSLLCIAFCSQFTEEKFVFDRSGLGCWLVPSVDNNNCFIWNIIKLYIEFK